ncbi:type II secretion system protein [Desulfatiglans anilini]|uniref:type II secretion system protein n=1 Tax=Desulfatiglans anilini TaxID=90728 RepID=UPI00040BB3EE|nr:prepilin-type N-terminal cleavage/methylation domain-containing protein [Desulfatiglans anilini]
MKSGVRSSGFTLVEVIATLVIMALGGVAVFTFLHGAVTRSSEPVAMAQDLASAMDTMEEITALYHDYRKGDLSWQAFKTDLGDYPVTTADKEDAMGNPGFEIVMVTVNTGCQSLSTFFSE